MKTNHLWLTIIGLSLLTASSPATVRYVNLNNTSPAAPYTSWATAATNIQAASDISAPGDLVLVTNGVYQTGTVSMFGLTRVKVNEGITVRSVNGPGVTLIKGYQVPGTTNGPGSVSCVYLPDGSTLSGFTLTNGSTTFRGGGIYCKGTTPATIVTNCIITGNSASSYGGGGYGGTYLNCIISSNTSFADGGGIYGGPAANCAIIGNSAQNGGGIYGAGPINCTISGNTASGQGGGIDGASSYTMNNCIIYYNTAPSGSNYANIKMNYCCTVPSIDLNSITNEPLFVNPAAGNFRLQAGSPCVNAGNNAYATNGADLDGNFRILGGKVDLGAYELQPPIHYVNLLNLTPLTPYTNWVTAATNIQDAIDVAAAGDFIVVSNGVYRTGGRPVYGAATNRVTVNKAVMVQSVNGPDLTVIEGFGGASQSPGIRCAYLTNGAALIGFTLTNGAARSSGDITNERSGGGIWCESVSATVSNCVLTRNYANQNGGAAFQGTLNNCILTNNQAFMNGGGAYGANLNNCLVSSNKLVQGSGGGGTAFGVLSNCVITWNFAPGYGGGTYYSTLNHCVVSNNAAQLGGGTCFGLANNSLLSSNRTLPAGYGGGAFSNQLVNCVVSGNFAGDGGGGACRSTLLNCTVVSNTAGTWGGGAYGGVLTNCILYYNFALKNPNVQTESDSTVNYSDTILLVPNGPGNITNEPVFVNLAAGDFHLQSNSPCINAGNNASVVAAKDLDGNPRIIGGTVDMGAYECLSPALLAYYSWLQNYGLPTDASAVYADSDGDGMNNWQEWRTGTLPNNPASLLKLSAPYYHPDQSGTLVLWQGVTGITYFIQRSSDLAAPFSTIATNIAGSTYVTIYLDTTAVGAGPFFYRVGVQ